MTDAQAEALACTALGLVKELNVYVLIISTPEGYLTWSHLDYESAFEQLADWVSEQWDDAMVENGDSDMYAADALFNYGRTEFVETYFERATDEDWSVEHTILPIPYSAVKELFDA